MIKACFAGLMAIFLPLAAVASTTNLTNPIGVDSLFQSASFIGLVINRILSVIGSLALLMLVYGGLTMVMSGGNEKKVALGKEIITYTAIGLVLIFMSYAIITFFLNGVLKGQIKDEYQDLPVVTSVVPSSGNDVSSVNACEGCYLPDGTRYCQATGCNQSCSFCQPADSVPPIACSDCVVKQDNDDPLLFDSCARSNCQFIFCLDNSSCDSQPNPQCVAKGFCQDDPAGNCHPYCNPEISCSLQNTDCSQCCL